VLDIDAAPSQSDTQLILQKSHLRIARWRLRTGIAGFSLALVYLVGLLIDPHPNVKSDLFFAIAISVLLVLWLVTILCGALWYQAWKVDRDFRKIHLKSN